MSQYSTEPAGTTDQVKDQVREKAQVAQDKARGALGQARGRVSDQVDQRSTQAGERVAGTASDVRSIADELRNQGKDAPANLAEQVANQADRVGDYLKGASGDRILRDVEDFARRQQSGYQGWGDGDGRSYTSPYDTRTAYATGARYETEVPYAPSTTPAAGTPVVGTYDPDPVEGEPLRDAYDERRS
jgi:hypothetical protein